MSVARLDGNSIAGLLEMLFGRDLTTAHGRCGHCGAEHDVGALHVYRAAGIVVRCPDCDGVLMRFVEARDRSWIDLRGVALLRLLH
jgi:Family of unknown function (DUF6510)